MARLAANTTAPVMLALLLTACAGNKPRPAPAADTGRPAPVAPVAADARSGFARACAPTRVHDERDYTPGGLYAPGVSDGGPSERIDVSAVLEPVPREEPRSRYGNRSPYTVLGKSYRVLDSARGYHERGVASWYGTKFNGRATSSGEIYDICQFTAAHKTLPLPSFVRVTNLDNGRSLVVRVNDRGPFHAGRVMDLSYAAAVRLGVDRMGTARVEIEAVGPGETRRDESVIASADPRGEVTLQVGSFAGRDNASRLAERLRQAGVDAVAVDHVEVGGRALWRVRVGPVSAGGIEDVQRRLRSLELPEARVVRE